MRILDAKVRWMFGYANNPTFKVLVDEIPKNRAYEQKGSLYFSNIDGYVSFYFYNEPGEGYGGSKFELKMKDGSTKVLIGPWSSRPGVMNAAGFDPCVHCSITDEKEVWKRGYTFYAGNISLDKAISAAKIAKVHLLMTIYHYGTSQESNTEQSLAIGFANTDNYEFSFCPSISKSVIDKPLDGEKNPEHRGGFKPIDGILVYNHEEDEIMHEKLLTKVSNYLSRNK